MKFALIVDGAVREVFAEAPVLHPSLRVVSAPASVQIGWTMAADGTVSAPTPAAPTPDQNKTAAKALLEKTDLVALRCVKAGVAFPANWLAYVTALRAIVASGALPSGGMPAQPAYPAGT